MASITEWFLPCLAILWIPSSAEVVSVAQPIPGGATCTEGSNLLQNAVVGQSLIFFCQSNILTGIPSWTVNSTSYHWSRLPDDYMFYTDTAKGGYTFVIPVVKLWMNNTKFGCANVTTSMVIGCLYVSFDLNGPSNNHINDNTVQVTCFNDLFTQYIFYVMWNISGTYYDSTRMPPEYIQKPDGLLVLGADRLENVTVQCLVYSDLLLRQSFYYSELVTLPQVFGSIGTTISPLPSTRIYFNFNKFDFNDSYRTIYWKPPEGCNFPVKYELYDWMLNSTSKITLNTTEYSIPAGDLINGYHYWYLLARSQQSGDICSIGDYALYIPSDVKIQTHYMIENEHFCIMELEIQQSYTWPYSPTSNLSCTCTRIGIIKERCYCLTSTDYWVFANETTICWYNFVASFNNTVIVVTTSLPIRDSRKPPYVNFTTFINETHRIIIEGKPSPPVATSNRSGSNLCLTYVDTFRGVSPVTEYFVNVTDGTGLYFSYTQEKIDETACAKLPPDKQQLLSDDCGNLTLELRSKNKVNLSDVFTLRVNSGPEYNICRCFDSNVNVEVSSSVSGSQTLHINFKCTSKGYVNLNDARFKVQLTSNTSNVQNTANCSGSLEIPDLDLESKNYNLLIQWISPNSATCTIMRTTYPTTNTNVPLSLTVIILVSVLAFFVILVVIMVIVLIICCYGRNTLKNELVELQNKAELQNRANTDQRAISTQMTNGEQRQPSIGDNRSEDLLDEEAGSREEAKAENETNKSGGSSPNHDAEVQVQVNETRS